MTARPANVLTSPTTANRTGAPAGVLALARVERVLRSQRDPCHPALKHAQCPQHVRKEESEPDRGLRKPCADHTTREPTWLQQDRVFIEGARVDGMYREGIVRIVLEYEQGPVGAKNAADLRKDADMLRVRNVVQNACQKRQVEVIVRKGDEISVKVHELRLPPKSRGTDLQALARNVEARKAAVWKVFAEVRYRSADPAPKSSIAGVLLPNDSPSRSKMSTILYSAKYSGASPDRRMSAACICRYSSANLSNSASSTVSSASPVLFETHTRGAQRENRCRTSCASRQLVSIGKRGIGCPYASAQTSFITRSRNPAPPHRNR